MTVTERRVPSSDSGRKRKPRDPRGNEHGVIAPAPEGGNLDRDCLISIRWIARRLCDVSGTAGLEREDDEFVDNVDDVASSFARAAAMWAAFRLLWRADNRRVRAGIVIDAAELFATGRYGTIEQIITGLKTGRFDDLPRDADGFLAVEVIAADRD
jgi:hypothetical protein